MTYPLNRMVWGTQSFGLGPLFNAVLLLFMTASLTVSFTW